MHKSNSRGATEVAPHGRVLSRKDLVKNDCTNLLVKLCTGTKHAAEIGVITKADDIVCAVHAYKAGATKNVAMRFYYAGAAL